MRAQCSRYVESMDECYYGDHDVPLVALASEVRRVHLDTVCGKFWLESMSCPDEMTRHVSNAWQMIVGKKSSFGSFESQDLRVAMHFINQRMVQIDDSLSSSRTQKIALVNNLWWMLLEHHFKWNRESLRHLLHVAAEACHDETAILSWIPDPVDSRPYHESTCVEKWPGCTIGPDVTLYSTCGIKFRHPHTGRVRCTIPPATRLRFWNWMPTDGNGWNSSARRCLVSAEGPTCYTDKISLTLYPCEISKLQGGSSQWEK